MGAPPLVKAGPLPGPPRAATDADLYRSLGSMEGVPEPAGTQGVAPARPTQLSAHERFAALGTLVAGLLLAAMLAALSEGVVRQLIPFALGVERSPISPILLAIALGMTVRALLGLPAVYDRGLEFASTRILRLGVALLGLQLSLAGIGHVGLRAIPLILICVTAAILSARWFGRRFGVPGRLSTLIAVGTAVCGNTAIAATAPAIAADEDETSYAVGCVTAFGTIALLAYPFLAHVAFAGEAEQVGLFLGTAIHDTAQVAGAGLVYLQQYSSPFALETAMVTKLIRNAGMIVLIPLMVALAPAGGGGGSRPRFGWRAALPPFVLGFLGLALLRTLVDVGPSELGNAVVSEQVLMAAKDASMLCLAVAMAAIGLRTDLGRLRKLGLRPLLVGFAVASTVGACSVVFIRAILA